jgi:hypothetical protein
LVDGFIESVDLRTHSVIIRDLTPLEATIQFFFDTATTYSPLAGTPKPVSLTGPLPFTAGQTVGIQWRRNPDDGSKKMAVSIIERR